MTTTTTYDWLKHLPSAFLQSDTIPLVGSPPSFPWDVFSSKIADIFSLKGLKIAPSTAFDWRTPEDLVSGLGTQPVPLYMTLVPSLPPICWVMGAEDLQKLMSLLLSLEDEAIKGLDVDFREGFYRFLALEAANTLLHVDFDKTLSPNLQDNKSLPNETSLCLDVSVTHAQKTIGGRLILSPAFRKAWQERYTPRSLDVPKPILQHLEVTVSFEIGRTLLKLTDWAGIHPGDFVVLDSCSLKPSGDGRIILKLNGAPIFRGKIKDGNIKILEHPLYHEEEITMADSQHNEEEEEVFEDEEFEDEEQDELEEEELEEDFEESSEGLEEAEEEIAEEIDEEHPPDASQKAAPAAEKQSVTAGPAPVSSVKKPFSPEDIPLSITVEVGRVQMSLQKVMELQPGNLLELNVRPENGVDLVVNGKRIAKGELLLVGEALGVRILDIG